MQKYELVKRINRTVETKQGESLNTIIDKREHHLIKHFPIFLSYDYNNDLYNSDNDKIDKYSISVILSDSVLVFPINNLNEVLFSLKEGMVFPGDKVIGLEAIELLDNRKDNWYWKAKCLLCGRIIEISHSNIKKYKSCGCLGGRDFNSDEDRFLSYVDKQENIPKELQIRGTLGIDEESCWLWTGYKNKGGYGKFSLNKQSILSHRYSWILYRSNGLSNPKVLICHRCDNPSCVNPDHLFEGTQLDNMQDMISKGREDRDNKAKGEDHSSHKLTEKEVLEIRAIRGKTQRRIAKEYGISRRAICDIIKRRTWRHI